MGANAGQNIMDVRDLGISTEQGAPVLFGVDISLKPGEIVGLTGPSGSGKSTLALALLGMVRRGLRFDGGAVRFEGHDLLALGEAEIRTIRGRDIGLITQSPRAAFHPMLTIGRQIGRFWMSHTGGSKAAARARAIEMLKRVGINDPARRVDAYIHELSGGMAQRALIALALSTEPRLLIADDPTSGLDVTVQAQFLDAMWKAARDVGTAMILATQDRGVIANYCDRVIEIRDGMITRKSSVRDYFAQASQGGRDKNFERADASSPVIIRVDGLRKTFPLRGTDKVVQAVDDLTLSIRAGESLGLVGESGSGKSTAGRCILGLLGRDRGVIEFDGSAIPASGVALRQFRQRAQIVQQDPNETFDPRWTIGHSLADPLRVHRVVPRAGIRREVTRLVELVSLDPAVLDRRPRDLGAGTLQRLAIARALATQPDFLVLDEPTSVLAPEDCRIILDLLDNLCRDLNIAYLFISHDLTSIASACNRVAVMYLGQIVEVGVTGDIFNDPAHPYTQALIAAYLEEDPYNRRVDRTVEAQLSSDIPSPVDLPPGCNLAPRCPRAEPACHSETQVLEAAGNGRLVRCKPYMEELQTVGTE